MSDNDTNTDPNWAFKWFNAYWDRWLAGERNQMVESGIRFWANSYKRRMSETHSQHMR